MPKTGSDFKLAIPLNEQGESGLKVQNGLIKEEFLKQLQFPKSAAVYEEMSKNDPIVFGMLFAIEMIIRKVEWKAVPAGGNEATESAKEAAEFLDQVMGDMEKSWPDVINDIMSFLPQGYAVHEKVYKKRGGMKTKDRRFKSKYNDGMWGWRKLPARSQDTLIRWAFKGDWSGANYRVGDVNDLTGVVQRSPNTFNEVNIKRKKFLLFRNNTKKDNPESISMLRGAYRPWFFKKNIEETEAIGIERDLAGLPVASLPPEYMSANATPDQKQVYAAVKDIVTSIRANEQGGIVWPLAYDEKGKELFKIELLGNSSGGGKNFDTNQTIQRYASQIAQTVLADFILLGQQSTGSFALSSNKVKLFHAAISAWLDSIADVFNKDAIPELWEVNDFPLEDMPTLGYGQIDNFDLADLGAYFADLAAKGLITPDATLEAFLRQAADAPDADGSPMKSEAERVQDIKNEGVANAEGIKNDGKMAVVERSAVLNKEAGDNGKSSVGGQPSKNATSKDDPTDDNGKN